MFTKAQVNKVMTELSKKTACFVSESHLQTSFVIEAAKQNEKYEFYPEYTVYKNKLPKNFIKNIGQGSARFDLVIVDKKSGDKTIIEFKYKTKEFFDNNHVLNFDIELTNQAAHNLTEYDIWKDISRIEHMVGSNKEYKNGFVIFITNDMLYPNGRNLNAKYGRAFSVENGQHKKGTKIWNPTPPPKTVSKNRLGKLIIKNTYNFDYKKFSSFPENKNGDFMSLIIEIS